MREHDQRPKVEQQAPQTATSESPSGGAASAQLQRKLRRKLARQRAEGAGGDGLGHDASDKVARADGGAGAPLPGPLEQKFGAALGADLSGVRVHTGEASAAAANAVSAQAYTVGNNIHFAAGKYDPASGSGQHLLAHEVAHTVQQGGAPSMQTKLEVSQPEDASETEADSAADAMVRGERTAVGGGPAQISREPERPQGDPDAGPPETPYDGTAWSLGDGTPILAGPRSNAQVLQTLANNASAKVTGQAGNYWVVQTTSGKKGYLLKGSVDVDGPATATDEAAPVDPFQPIIDKATQGPASVTGEKVWVLERGYWHELKPLAYADLHGVGIGGPQGWLQVDVLPVLVPSFGSVPEPYLKTDPPPKDNFGLLSYKGSYLLWKNAWHPNHDPKGAGPTTGHYRALEAYKLPPDVVAKYETKKNKKPAGK